MLAHEAQRNAVRQHAGRWLVTGRHLGTAEVLCQFDRQDLLIDAAEPVDQLDERFLSLALGQADRLGLLWRDLRTLA